MEIIRKISADERFELHYYGREQQIAFNLKSYVKNNRVKNVFFHGEYRNEERYKFARKTDIIHNIYHDKNTMLAMGNKYYDGLLFYLPQLCMEGSYMGESCQKHDVGISLNPYKEGFTDRIYEYYKGIDTALFKSKCDEALSGVMEEYYEGEKMLDKCLSFEK
ncbi:MAG: hypothetical protein GX061_08430 [Eubacteriaceae bacterium]|nr:hypothetical protein [Eubacteriaceae bacterium]